LSISGIVIVAITGNGEIKRGMEMTNSTTPEWKVEVDPSRDLTENEHDVIVIGAGIGGLACTATLAKWGYRPLLLEHHSQVGGYYGSFERDGFLFETGATEITGLWDGGPLDLFLKDIGLKKEDYFVPNSYNYTIAGSKIEAFDGVEAFKRQLSDLFPQESSNIDAFFSDAKAAFDEWYVHLMSGMRNWTGMGRSYPRSSLRLCLANVRLNDSTGRALASPIGIPSRGSRSWMIISPIKD
jgi:phytoene dehydrogenase-like protein